MDVTADGGCGKSRGLYIHIPFCKAKCNYCDFNSYAGREELIEPYFEALGKEIRLCAGLASDLPFGTVFIGGGTPSLAEPGLIENILDECRRSFVFTGSPEITIESNPGTLTYDRLVRYGKAGVNRLSIGLQAWQDRLLRYLGRIHGIEQFKENYDLAVKAGFSNINIDLIFGLPGQTIEDWAETLENVVRLDPSHLSCYSLKIEEGTPFGDLLEKGELIPAEDELDREMYSYAVKRLSESGYRHYEISNFSRPGSECRHNLVYWKAREYLGLGAGAHSYIKGERYNNIYGIEDYIGSVRRGLVPSENLQTIDEKESMSEFMILGLRLTAGVAPGEFKARFGRDMFEVFGAPIKELIKRKLLADEAGRIALTPLGLDLANRVFSEFI